MFYFAEVKFTFRGVPLFTHFSSIGKSAYAWHHLFSYLNNCFFPGRFPAWFLTPRLAVCAFADRRDRTKKIRENNNKRREQ